MPRPKSWIGRIGHILKQLEREDREEYTRRQVEQLFSIGPTQAAELMQVAGMRPRGMGLDNIVSRANLLHYTRHCPEARDALQEMERRRKLAKKLSDAEGELKLRNVRLRVTREEDWSRFEDLPNVAIQAGLMQVVFTPGDPIDLLDTLYRFISAVAEDWDQVKGQWTELQRMCDAADPAPEGSEPERKAG